MGGYVLTRHIDATAEGVFKGFTDPSVMVDWMDLAAIRDATGPLDAAGTRYRMIVRGPWRFRNEILRCEPPHFIEYAGRGPLGATFRIRATLSARDGGTDLEQATEYGLPFGPIGRWMDHRWIDREPRTIANRELDRLVEIVSRHTA